MDDKKISDLFWKIKGIAIISVVCAHCNIQIDGAEWLRAVLNNIGTVGVGMFFFSSGYYFKYKNIKISKFLVNKITNQIFPWIIAATCVWIYIVIRKGEISLNEWAKYVIGNGSIYYFMFDFIFIQILFYMFCRIFRNIIPFCIGMVILNEIAILLEAAHISYAPTPYMNPFIFAGYFSIGVLCKEKELIPKLLNNKKHFCKIILSMFSFVILLQPFYYLSYYRDAFSFVIEILFIVTVMFLMYNCNNEFLYKLGKVSFFIYLWHLPLAGIISNIGSRNILLAYTAIFWPLVIIAIMFLLSNVLGEIKKLKVKKIFGLN